tara:strand:- start:304 stop:3591 length:3288 start_codon:yes stop_codon:yes gene_type:complete
MSSGTGENIIVLHRDTPSGDTKMFLVTKLSRFNEIIQNTYIHVNNCKAVGIFKTSEIKSCISDLRGSRKDVSKIYNEIQSNFISNYDELIKQIQKLNSDLSNILKKWGTQKFSDFLYVCYGKDYTTTLLNDVNVNLVSIVEKQFHPIKYVNFSLLGNKESLIGCKDTSMDYKIGEVIEMNTLDCFNISTSSQKSLFFNVNGIVVYLKNPRSNTGMFVVGYIDNLDIELVNSSLINDKYKSALTDVPEDIQYNKFKNFLQCITLKDWLIHKTNFELYNYYFGCFSEVKCFKQQSLISMSNEFINKVLFTKRTIIMFLLLDDEDVRSKYLAYFLYDLLTMDSTANVDAHEQSQLLDSFTWKMHELFNNSLLETIQYTSKITKLDSSKINLEQQICLLKVDDTVKEKAMAKLREVKAKSDDGGSKARYYLDGLLKIPFGVFVKEPIMESDIKIKSSFACLERKSKVVCDILKNNGMSNKILTTMDIQHVLKNINDDYTIHDISTFMESVLVKLKSKDKRFLVSSINSINKELEVVFSSLENVKKILLDSNKKTKQLLIQGIEGWIKKVSKKNFALENEKRKIIECFRPIVDDGYSIIKEDLSQINNIYDDVNNYISNVSDTLEKSVHGHKSAKKQILRIIGQWINGEQTGYCFGFEGPPGVGKTSLAKFGLSKCLEDEHGKSRPFSMIAIGGDANGSTLHGHNYTYVGSTWGSIVQILIDKKCMNPIIFIDELDKVSRTEHGREIIGILTHMLDPTQNDKFQDKYFSGIDIDLSKVLFVLSYNDPDLIDRILLDRIHRVKFSNLSMDEKIHISKTYTLPEIYKKVGLEGAINIEDDVIRYIIDNYTCEAGVRKLKEKLFEIVSDINLSLLTKENVEYPINVTIEDIKNIYFKDQRPVITVQVPTESKVGYANGLWANSAGQGGTLPIESFFYPSNQFLSLKLTGKQGDVMKESMNVALTLAYKMTPKDIIDDLAKKYNGDIKYGIHIHTPEGAVSKDGPSAGSCITTVLYSILNNRKIKARCGITGEIQLNGKITAIGGLDLKILGSIKSGITHYFYPEENSMDFEKFYEKYKDKEQITGISFKSVSTIDELIKEIVE